MSQPEGFVPIHFIVPHTSGRILSKNTSTGEKTQYAVVCDVKVGLPTRQVASHSLSGDPRVVSCPECQKTEVFLAAYKIQTGQDFKLDAPQENE